MSRLGLLGSGALVALFATFLVLPIIAVFVAAGPAELVGALGRESVTDAIRVSLTTNLIAQAIVIGFGTPAAYLISRGHRSKTLMTVLVELPLVLPPAVAGLGLLYTFGPEGLVGGFLSDAGVSIALTRTAVVLAVAYVSSPFFLRSAIAAFDNVDASAIDAAQTLGAGPFRVFTRIAIPIAARGLRAGAALGFARGLGEFGATIVFAGSLPGVTETLPLAVYGQLDRDPDAALATGAVLICLSVFLLGITKIGGQWQRSR